VKHISVFFSIGLSILSLSQSFAATWKEPWFIEIIAQTDYILKVEVRKANHSQSSVYILKTLVGKPLKGKQTIQGFHQLELCIQAGDPTPGIWLDNIDTCYLLLKRTKANRFSLPTPTSGIYPTSASWVQTAFQHSYHTEIIDLNDFEKLIVAYWNGIHNIPFDTNWIYTFCNEALSKEPALPDEEGFIDFCRQEIAMECIYALKLKGFNAKLRPFMFSRADRNRIAAFRAFSADPSPTITQWLFDDVRDPNMHRFVKWHALQTLIHSPFKPEKESLYRFLENSDNLYVGFGGDIRDPRICTSFDGIKSLISQLIHSIQD
jgi:hypothetical protein